MVTALQKVTYFSTLQAEPLTSVNAITVTVNGFPLPEWATPIINQALLAAMPSIIAAQLKENRAAAIAELRAQNTGLQSTIERNRTLILDLQGR